MTTTAIPGIEQAIDHAAAKRSRGNVSTDAVLEETISEWWWAFQRALWQRWECDSDSCPGTPAWDHALAEAGEAGIDALEAEVNALIRLRLAEFAARFQAEHPEAVLREVKPAE